LLGGVIYSVGGVHKGVETLAHINKGLVSPYGYKGILTYGFMASFWILVCFGLVGMPPTIIRAMAYKNSKSLYHAMLYATIAIIVIMFGINLAGAFGRILIPNVGVPDEVIPKLMLKVLPPLLAGVFLAAPMAAIMSTFTSVLIQASSVFVKDIYLSVYPSKATNSKLISRLSTIVILSIIGILFLLTIHPPRMLVWLNIFGLGGLEAVFFWVIVLGIFWKKANANGAIASMIVGFLVYLISNIFSYGTFDYKALAEALFCAGISFVIFNNIKLKQKR
ncbi:MAG: sodium/panthothenate symporter, partial [Psittacicella sp.]